MRILFFVNHFDAADDLQGFFVGWVRNVAQQASTVIVIAQHVGTYDVPGNVRVVSLEKSKNPSPAVRVVRFMYKLIRLRREYDHCVVMMAPSWSIITSLIARLFGRTSYLWYAVWKGTAVLRFATALSTRVFTSVPEAFPFSSPKVLALGQGIDTDLFVPAAESRKEGTLLFLGRISPVKKIEFLLQGLAALRVTYPELLNCVRVNIAGAPINARDHEYYRGLQKKAHDLQLDGNVQWPGRIPHNQVLSWYQEADIVVNMTPVGSFDKAMLEAMASGALVLASNEALRRYYTPELQQALLYAAGDQDDFVQKLQTLLSMPKERKDAIRSASRAVIQEHHSQQQWTKRFIAALS